MESLNSLKKQELLDLAKERNLPATTKMTKDQLIALINDSSIQVTKPAKPKVEKDTKPAKTTKPKSEKNERVTKSASPKVEKADTPKKVAKTTASKKVSTTKSSPTAKTIKVAKSSKIAVPTKDLIATFDNNITILVQSHDTALIIWNADPALDEQVSGWRFKNDKGLDIFLPSYARSAFVSVSLLQLSEHIVSFILLRLGEDGSQTEYTNYYTTTFREYHHHATDAEVQAHLDEYSKIQYRFNS